MTTETDAINPKVLIVDDSRVIRVAAKKILRDTYALAEAGDGAEAMQVLARETDVAVVLSDLSMPNMGGMELLTRLRASSENYLQDIPVIIVTGAEDDDGTRDKAMSAGANDFITKPFDQAQLLACIEAQIGKTGNKAPETPAAPELVAPPVPAPEVIPAPVPEACTTNDAVTGLLNMRGFQSQGKQAIAYSVRHRTDLALIVIEPDQIETLDESPEKNTTGTDVVREIAGIIRRNIRCEDIAARIDGYRFAVLSPGANSIGARRLARRVCSEIAEWRCPAPAMVNRITLSAGVVAEDVQRDTHLDELIAEGVDRMLAARSSGGNQVIYAQGVRVPSHSLDIPTLPDPEPVDAPAPIASWEPDTRPQAAPRVPEPVAPSPEAPAPDLNRALQLLKSGLTERVDPHLRTLVRECLPLLEHWNRSRNLQLDSELDRIRQACREPDIDVPPLPAEAKSLL